MVASEPISNANEVSSKPPTSARELWISIYGGKERVTRLSRSLVLRETRCSCSVHYREQNLGCVTTWRVLPATENSPSCAASTYKSNLCSCGDTKVCRVLTRLHVQRPTGRCLIWCAYRYSFLSCQVTAPALLLTWPLRTDSLRVQP